MTGRFAAQTGYGKSHPLLLDFNPTLASVLKERGLRDGRPRWTTRTWPPRSATRGASTATARRGRRRRWRARWTARGPSPRTAFAYLTQARARAAVPSLAPLREPPRPVRAARPVRHGLPRRRRLGAGRGSAPVDGFHGGAPKQWAVPGKPLGWYVAQYDGEIAAVDAEVGRVLEALDASAVRDRTLVVLTLRPRGEPRRARLLLRPRRGPVRPLDADPPDRGRARARRRGRGRTSSPRRSTSSRRSSTR